MLSFAPRIELDGKVSQQTSRRSSYLMHRVKRANGQKYYVDDYVMFRTRHALKQ
jgi:hypothetical protein